MSLNPEPADPIVRREHHLPPKSYANAAEEALHPHPDDQNIIDDDTAEAALRYDVPDVVDEDAIKESPPRSDGHARSVSSPRPLGEVMDEMETESKAPNSPSLRHVRGRIEEHDGRETYAEVVQHEPNSLHRPQTPNDTSSKGKVFGATNGHATNNGHLNGDADEKKADSDLDNTKSKTLEVSGQKGDTSERLVYENLHSRSGSNLATIATEANISHQRVDTPRTSDRKRDGDSLVSGRRAGAGWAASPIRWAPLNIPVQRRLQTCAVLAHTLSIGGGLAFFFLLCTIPLLWPILVPYLLYILLSRAAVDGELSQRSNWMRSSRLWSLFAGYFPARLHRTQELEPTRKYIFGYHPHGIISHGAFAAFATEALGFNQLFPGITNTLLTLDSNFRIPLYRDYALRMGLGSVSRESCENILSKGGPNGEGMGRAITIVIGGARESLDAKPNTMRLVLKRRKGFVKLAIRAGADLVPVLAFGENDIYDQVDNAEHPYIHKTQLLIKKFMGFTVPLFHARGIFNYDVGLMPYRRPINIVTGNAIKIKQSPQPDPSYVDQVHQQYVDELMRLWDDWKDQFAPDRKAELRVIE